MAPPAVVLYRKTAVAYRICIVGPQRYDNERLYSNGENIIHSICVRGGLTIGPRGNKKYSCRLSCFIHRETSNAISTGKFYRCGRTIGHLTDGNFACDGSSTFLFAFPMSF